MTPELETIRQSLEKAGALDDETSEALRALETALSHSNNPDLSNRVRDIVAETAESLADNDTPSTTLSSDLSAKWRDLRDALSLWEKEHPGIVLAIGRLSNSLATYGL